MIRFVVVSSIRRGVIEPPELLGEADQAMIFERYEAEVLLERERVYWRKGEPYVGQRMPGAEREPRISERLRASLTGAQIINEDSQLGVRTARRRMAG